MAVSKSQNNMDRLVAALETETQALGPLLYHLLRQEKSWRRYPSSLRKKLEREAKAQALSDEVSEPEIRRVLRGLARADVPVLLLKGAALSYSVYPVSGLRPRCDTDLLLPVEKREIAEKAMEALGYSAVPATAGEIVRHQRSWSRPIPAHLESLFDLHWRLSERVLFSRLFSFEELRRKAVPVPALGEAAFRPDDLHCTIIACVHRVAHHHDAGDLIWLYDLRFLLQGKSREWLEALAELARKKGVGAICAHGLLLARDRCGAEFDDETFSICFPSDLARREKTAAYLSGDRSWAHELVGELAALPSWAQRLQLLREHAFPPAEFIQAKYAVRGRTLLPALYAWRLLGGMRKLLQPR